MYFTIEKDIPFSKLNQWVIHFVYIPYNLIKGAQIHVRTNPLMMLIIIITHMPTITPILAINHMSTITPMSNPSRVSDIFLHEFSEPYGHYQFYTQYKRYRLYHYYDNGCTRFFPCDSGPGRVSRGIYFFR